MDRQDAIHCHEPVDVAAENSDDMISVEAFSETGNDTILVRMVIALKTEFVRRRGVPGWNMSSEGIPFHVQPRSHKYIDPRQQWPNWHYRSTLLMNDDCPEQYLVVEWCSKFAVKDDAFGEIEECGGRPYTVVTIMHKEPVDPKSVGAVIELDDVQDGGELVVPEGVEEPDVFAAEADVPAELQDAPGAIGLQPDRAVVVDRNQESLTISGVILTPNSSVRALREAAEHLNVNRS